MASSREFQESERAILEVQRRNVGNTYCADCSDQSETEYVNLTVGTFICKVCADVHKNISNRRIKDIYGRDLTEADVRRMADVGNDKANRRFLATWDPNEFPEPDTQDRERLLNFIWLKYEGSWKKSAPPPQSREDPRYERPGQGYGREHDLFRQTDQRHDARAAGASNPAPPPRRSVWAERLGFVPPASSHREQAHVRDDYRFPVQDQHHNRFAHEGGRSRNDSRFAQEAAPPTQDRFATSRGGDRFRPPVAPAPSYGGQRPNQQQSRYREEYDEDYERPRVAEMANTTSTRKLRRKKRRKIMKNTRAKRRRKERKTRGKRSRRRRRAEEERKSAARKKARTTIPTLSPRLTSANPAMEARKLPRAAQRLSLILCRTGWEATTMSYTLLPRLRRPPFRLLRNRKCRSKSICNKCPWRPCPCMAGWWPQTPPLRTSPACRTTGWCPQLWGCLPLWGCRPWFKCRPVLSAEWQICPSRPSNNNNHNTWASRKCSKRLPRHRRRRHNTKCTNRARLSRRLLKDHHRVDNIYTRYNFFHFLLS